MKPPKRILLIDAIINLFLGIILLIFSPKVIELLGIPAVEHYFYPNILGGVLVGIGIALLIECFKASRGVVGLGLGGAVAINLCASVVLGVWLIFGKLQIPLRGQILLWIIVVVVIAVSSVELVVHKKIRNLC